MMTRNPEEAMKIAGLLKRQTPQLDSGELRSFVSSFIDRRQSFLETVLKHGSPLYVLDEAALLNRARQFKTAFASVLSSVKVFYAVKSNSHPAVARAVVRAGCGLDVSSGLELGAALETDAEEIIFSGPGKMDSELHLAVQNNQRVTVLMDSFGELQKLEKVAVGQGKSIRAGVRLTTDESGIWRKFGIPLSQLSRFFAEADKCRHVELSGLQFHLSWNLNPDKYVVFIVSLGSALRGLERSYRQAIKFLDIGGGYWPPQGEWLQAAATPEGVLRQTLLQTSGNTSDHYKYASVTIDDFANHIAQALKKQIPDDMSYTVYTEPGRWLSNEAMHILLTVVDRKAADVIITDGGTHAVGWERFESDYFPIINLSRPSLSEKECLIAGSLCTPHDIWGYTCFGDDVQVGDVLLVPNQGAYTYSLRQNFIKPLPEVVELVNVESGVLLPSATRKPGS
ncbi:MAG: alanine racemase [Candidatus Zixiibacteriota bacterium]